MSYGNLTYTLTFRDTLYKLGTDYTKLWKVNIYKKGYSGSPITVTGAGSPVTISYKKNSLITAVCGSECTISLMATSAAQFDDFLTCEPLAYYVDIQSSTDGGSTWLTYWSGVNTTDTYSQAHSNVPYQCNLKFNCGLGELQWHRYENAGALTAGLETVLEIINNCMTFLPFTNKGIVEIINIREDTMLDSQGLLEQLYVNDMIMTEIGDDGETHGWNCNKVLNSILSSINCRIYQANNTWYVERIYERVNTSPYYFYYDTFNTWQTGNDWQRGGSWTKGIASGTLNWIRSIDNAAVPFIQKTSEKAVTQKQPILTYKFNTQSIANLQLLPEPYIMDTPLDKDVSGRPRRWQASSSIISAGGDGIETVDSWADIDYQAGYSFGSTVQSANQSYWAANVAPRFGYGTSLINAGFPLTPYYIYGVRNHGDTYTLPYVFLDPGNGTLQFNLQYWIEIEITPSYTSQPSSSQLQSDAYLACSNACGAYLQVFQMSFIRISDGHIYYLNGQEAVTGSGGNYNWLSGAGSYLLRTGNFQVMMANWPIMASGYNGGAPSSWSSNYLDNMMSLLQASYNPNTHTCTPFKVAFPVVNQWTTGFNVSSGDPFSNTPQPYAFDFTAFPLVQCPFTYPSGSKVTWSISDYAIRAVDIQYKDNAQSATSNVVFYATSDEDLRWNELTITAVFGDTNTAGYPGSFCVWNPSNSAQQGINTGTWHNRLLNVASGSLVVGNQYTVYDPNSTGLTITYNGINYTAGELFISVTGHLTYTVAAGSGYVVWTGQVLADIFFQNFAQIPANYRSNLRGSAIFDNSYAFWQTIEDEDGTLYMVTGDTYDIKNSKHTTDMEGMADLGIPISPTRSVPSTRIKPVVPYHTNPIPITPLISPIKSTPVQGQSRTIGVNNPNYTI
ncbi:MAG: hypothetical protein ACLQQ4_09545 [Bacteroidia bacterium]